MYESASNPAHNEHASVRMKPGKCGYRHTVTSPVGSFLCPPGFTGPKGLRALAREGSAVAEAVRFVHQPAEIVGLTVGTRGGEQADAVVSPVARTGEVGQRRKHGHRQRGVPGAGGHEEGQGDVDHEHQSPEHRGRCAADGAFQRVEDRVELAAEHEMAASASVMFRSAKSLAFCDIVFLRVAATDCAIRFQ